MIRKAFRSPAAAWNRWKEPWAWTAAGAAMGWFIGAHWAYLAYIAFTVGNLDRAIMWGIFAIIFAVAGSLALHFRPGRHIVPRSDGIQGEERA